MQNRSRRSKIVLLALLVAITTPVLAIATETTVLDPSDSDFYDRTSDLQIQWNTTWSGNNVTEIVNTTITVSDGDDTMNKVVTPGDVLRTNEFAVNQYLLTQNDLSSLENGTWTVTVTDRFNKTVRVVGGQEDANTSDNVNIEAGAFGSVSSNIITPDTGTTYSRGDSLTVKWNAVNDYNVEQTLIETTFTFTDENGNTVSRTRTINTRVAPGSNLTSTESFSASTFDSLSDGTWTLTINDTWEHAYGNDTGTFTAETPQYDVHTTIVIPDQDTTYDRTQDLTVQWNSSNELAEDERLNKSTLIITDETGNSVTETKTINTIVEADTTQSNSLTISSSQLSDLNDGTWTLTINDTWQAGHSTDTTTFTAEKDYNVATDIITPTSVTTYDRNQSLTVKWNATNNNNVEQRLNNSLLRFVDESGNTATHTETINTIVNAGATRTVSVSLPISTFDSLNDGTWTLTINDTWQAGHSTDTTTFTADSTAGGGTTTEKVLLTINQPDAGSSYQLGTDLTVEWTSTNDFNTAQNLVDARVRVEGGSGRSYSETVAIGETVSAGDSITNTATLTAGELDSLDKGTWTLTVTDNWEQASNDTSLSFNAVENISEGPSLDINVQSPSNGANIVIREASRQLTLSLTIQNSDTAQTVTTDLTVSDSTGTQVTASPGFQLAAGEQRTVSYTFSHNQLNTLKHPGTWTLDITATGSQTGKSTSTSLTINTKPAPDNAATITLNQPAPGKEVTLTAGARHLNVAATLANYGPGATITGSLTVSDGSETAKWRFSRSVASNTDITLDHTFNHTALTELSLDREWTVTARATKQQTHTDSVTFPVAKNTVKTEPGSNIGIKLASVNPASIDPGNRRLTLTYIVTNTGGQQTIDLTFTVSDGSNTATAAVSRTLQQGETQTLTHTFSHDKLSKLDMSESWNISIQTQDQQGTTTATSTSINPTATDGTGKGVSSTSRGIPLLPAAAIGILILVAAIYIYRKRA